MHIFGSETAFQIPCEPGSSFCRSTANYDASSTPANVYVRPSSGLSPWVLEQGTGAKADQGRACDITLANTATATALTARNEDVKKKMFDKLVAKNVLRVILGQKLVKIGRITPIF